MLKRECPEIYKRATWEMRALNLARRVDVQRPKPEPVVELEPAIFRPKGKPSPEEFRERVIHREQTRTLDKIAKAKTRIEGVINAQKMLDEFSLDPSYRLRLEAEVVSQIMDDENPDGSDVL